MAISLVCADGAGGAEIDRISRRRQRTCAGRTVLRWMAGRARPGVPQSETEAVCGAVRNL